MYEIQYNYVKNKYGNNSRLLFTDTDSLMYKIKTREIYEDFGKDKKMSCFINYLAKSKYYDYSSKLVVGNMEDETTGVAIEEFVRLKPKMHSFSANDSSGHKNKSCNRNVVATISHSEYKGVLLNNKCLRHSMKRLQSKNYRIGTYEINKISLSCFDDEIHILNNGYD